MRHGITISDRDKEEMLGFFGRGIPDGQPPSWISWFVYDATTDDAEIPESPVSSEDSDEEYQPFVHLRENPDGKRCRCGSTTHLTVNSHACPLNPRNRDDNDDGTGERENDNAKDDSSSDTPDEEEEQTLAEVVATLPVRPSQRRLGMPTRRRRLIGDDGHTRATSRPRVVNDTDDANTLPQEIQVGTKVQSSGTRWNLPAGTIFKGVVVAVKKNRRGLLTFHVKWQDGVVEYMKEEHIRPMCVQT